VQLLKNRLRLFLSQKGPLFRRKPAFVGPVFDFVQAFDMGKSHRRPNVATIKGTLKIAAGMHPTAYFNHQ
jgi:hypothetical protein